MNRYQAAIYAGMVAFFLGLVLVGEVLDVPRQYDTLEIPAGLQSFRAIPVPIPRGGQLSMEISVLSEGTAVGLALDETGFALYQVNRTQATPLLVLTGDRDRGFVDVPPGNYVLVVEHGQGFENVPQRVYVIFRVIAVDPVLLGGAVAVVLGGAATGVGGWFALKQVLRKARRLGVLPDPPDVYFFPPPGDRNP